MDQRGSTSNETTSFVATMACIAKNPKICGGEPTIFGTRITVSDIVELHHSLGWDIQKILDEYPWLAEQQIIAALQYHQHEENK